MGPLTCRPSGIARPWRLLSPDHEARFGFEASPVDLDATVTTEPDKLVRMSVTSGFPFWRDSTWEWRLSAPLRTQTGRRNRHPPTVLPSTGLSLDVQPVLLVHRPRRDVAVFMFDPGDDLCLDRRYHLEPAIAAAPLSEGTSVQRTARFLGRSFTYGYLITKHEPDRARQDDRAAAVSDARPLRASTMRRTAPSSPSARRARPGASSDSRRRY